MDYRSYYTHLNAELSKNIESLVTHLLGSPSTKTSSTWRFGRKGSVMVFVEGPNKGRFFDFEQDIAGNALDLVAHVHHLRGKDLCQWARQWLGMDKTVWTPMMPIPPHAPPPLLSDFPLSYLTKDRTETARYAYKNEDGDLMGYVVRLEDKNGQKITPMLTFCTDQFGRFSWRWQGFGANRPLYKLDDLANNITKPVLIVEGEKTAEAAALLFPTHVAMTWSGGTGAVRQTDWNPLKNSRIIIWPDNDDAGKKAALAIENLLQPLAASAYIVPIPQGFPPKWDLADPWPDNAMDTLTFAEIVFRR